MVQAGENDLRGGAFGAGMARRELLAHPQSRQPGDLGLGPQPQQPVVQARRALLGVLAPGPGRAADHPALARHREPADGNALVHQRALGDLPAVADLADPVRVRDPRVGQEDLVELGLAGELAERADLDPGRGHVEGEVTQAAVFRHVGVGSGDQDGPAGLVRQRGPYLLPGNDPVAARLADRAGRERGEVAAGAGLAEQLAPDLLADPQRPQPALAAACRCRTPGSSGPPCPAR